MSYEQVCFTEVTLLPNEGEDFDWHFADEFAMGEAYGQIINVLIKVAVELYQEKSDIRHLPFIKLPIEHTNYEL